ncbi:MAG: chloride channel protein [Flavisolibacter sp.]
MKEHVKRKIKFFANLALSNSVTHNALQAIPFWFASLVVGLLAVFYTKLFTHAEDLLHAALRWRSWSLLIITPLSFCLAWLVVVMFAPQARGSGIPQVMAAIDMAPTKNENKVNLLLSLKVLVVKIVSSLLMVLGGGAIGREGPTIQIAGSAFHIIRRWVPASWPKLSKQAFILTGAAAGLAAAFNTPLGGVVFAVEELAKIHIRFFRTALFSAVIVSGLTAQALIGPYLYLGYPIVSNLGFRSFYSVAAIAVISGLAGAFTAKMILKVMAWKRNFTRVQQLSFLVLAGLLVACIAIYVNDNILGSGKDIMNTVLFSKTKHVNAETALLRMLGPIVCFNTGAAGGVFAPALAAGAAIGSWAASLFDLVGSQANIIILGGMVGFLTGVTRTPFTSAILVLEMTDRHSVIFQLLLAAMISNVVALLIDRKSLYDRLKEDYMVEEKPVEPATLPAG